MKAQAKRDWRKDDRARREQLAAEGLLDREDAMSTASNMTSLSQMSVRTAGGTSTGLKFGQLRYRDKVALLLAQGEQGEERLLKERRKLEKDEKSWPDEVDVDREVTMRSRFQHYRGLKSFKHTPWEKNMALPLEYSQIFQFSNFSVSERNAKEAVDVTDIPEDLDEALAGGRQVRPGRAFPVTVLVANVPRAAAEALASGALPALLWALFRHEHKVSVLHMNVKRHDEFTLPVKNKDPMHIQIGFRRLTARPIFSSVVSGSDKTLVQRFMPRGKHVRASIYGRVTFPPAPVLMFAAQVLGSYKNEFPFNPLVASGVLASCDPNKLLIKRAVITGYPIQVHKMHAVIRYMFYNSDDVRWFKSCELWTKDGLHGHITEPRGLHGLFKCTFDSHVKSNDAVCISLYKREFPPWNPMLLG